ncbi:MAG: hypothetical protein FWD44_00825 [Oscillospiraceae bacterium]|nr:hypothetical protein [Oscillospiraceae bacterium]
MKKILALILAMVMCLGLFAACGDPDTPNVPPVVPGGPSGGDDGTPGTDRTPTADAAQRKALAEEYELPYFPEIMDYWEPIEFTYFIRNPGLEPDANNPIIKIIEQITNVKIVFDYLVGDYPTVMGVMLAGGETPDMLFVGGEADKLIESGWMMELGPLIEEYAPHLRAHYDPWWDRMMDEDGKIWVANIYGTPVGDQVAFEQNDSAFWLQKDVIDFMGGPPNDVYEFFEWIKAYKEAHPTIDGVPTLGFEFDTGVNLLTLMNPGSFLAGYANWGQGTLPTGGQRQGESYEDVIRRYPLESEKEWFRILNQAHADGLISPETFLRTFDEYTQNIANGVVLGLQDQRWNFNSAGMDPLRQQERYERTYVSFDFTWEGIEPNYWDMAGGFTGLNGIQFGHNNRDPIRNIQYLDYMIHESVQRFLNWGIEGEHYFYNDNGRIERPQEQRDLQGDPRWPIDNMGRELYNYMPKMQGTFPSDGNPTGIGGSAEEYFVSMNDYDKAFFTRHGILTEAGFMKGTPQLRPPEYPFWSMSLSRSQTAISTQLRDVNVSHLPQMVLANPADFDALWDAYVVAANAVDWNPILEAVREQAHARLVRAGLAS